MDHFQGNHESMVYTCIYFLIWFICLYFPNVAVWHILMFFAIIATIYFVYRIANE